MPLKHAILGLLNYTDMTGYDIDRYFKSSIAFFWHSQTSQIYKELNTLSDLHWVTSDIVYQSDKPNKKLFHISEEGKVELHRWLADANLEDIMKYKNPLLIKIFFSSNIDIDQTMRLLEKYIRNCSDIIDEMNEDINRIPEFEEKIHKDNESFFWGMTMTYGFMYYQNEIKWANWCIDKLKEKI
ncbi:PadR family transcriptional regulator [Amedibacillus sp. YH-ame10]